MRASTAYRYRTSAATLGCLLLLLYVGRGIFQMVLFPDAPIDTSHYHIYAPLAMAAGVLLLRMHGLGGPAWFALCGGLALMGGSFFALTALPDLSPFDAPAASAWCAVALVHFWTLASSRHSPLRTAIRRVAGIDEETWAQLRRVWGLCLVAACHIAVIVGIADFARDSYAVAPLLAGAASVLIHHGAIRRLAIYHVFAGIEITLALHADFVLASYIPKEAVIWVILGIWAGALAVHQVLGATRDLPPAGALAALFAAFTMAHVWYHEPTSTAGWWAVAAGAVLAALTPCASKTARGGEETLAAAMLPWVVAWLVFFALTPDWRHAPLPGPLLWTCAAVFLTGLAALRVRGSFFAAYARMASWRPRLADRTMAWLEARGAAVHTATLWLVFAVTAGLQIAHYDAAFATPEAVLMALLYAASAIAWYYEACRRKAALACIMMELCVLACFAAIRRQLMLTTFEWRYEFDVWASLAASLCLAGTKHLWERRAAALRTPLLGTLLALPVASILWVVYHGLGSNVALLVVGLHGVIAAFMGKNERESPYNIAATACLVAFVVISFWSKLELRVVYAYTVPVGIGILVLLQLFKARIADVTRNHIRLVTLLAMLCSAGYYALADDRHPIEFNLSLIALGVFAMVVGGILRIRLYAALGFAGLMVDLVSILCKTLAHAERTIRMTVVGSLVLAIGAVLIFGAIYFKTHRAECTARLDAWRRRFDAWE